MPYNIRELKLEDLSTKSFFETLSSLRPVEDLSDSVVAEIFTTGLKQGIKILVAEEDNFIVGTVRLFMEPKFYHGGQAVAHIEDVATHPAHFGKGIASILIKRAVEIAKENNCYKVILDCLDEVVGFYEKLGFQKASNGLRLDI